MISSEYGMSYFESLIQGQKLSWGKEGDFLRITALVNMNSYRKVKMENATKKKQSKKN